MRVKTKENCIHAFVRLSDSRITPKGLSLLFQTLKECKSEIKSIKFDKSGFTQDHMILIGEYVQGNQHLESLNMGWNKLDDRSIEVLADHLIGNTSLKYLGIREHIHVTDASAPFLMEIAKKSNLVKMDLDFTRLGYENISNIKKLLSISPDNREIPINSNSKSAAKITSSD